MSVQRGRFPFNSGIRMLAVWPVPAALVTSGHDADLKPHSTASEPALRREPAGKRRKQNAQTRLPSLKMKEELLRKSCQVSTVINIIRCHQTGLDRSTVQSKYPRQLFHWIKFPGLEFVYWKVCEWCAEPGAQVSKTSLDNGRYLKSHLRQYRILSTACLTHLSSDPISWLLKNDGSQSDLCFSPALCSHCIDFFFYRKTVLTTSRRSLVFPAMWLPHAGFTVSLSEHSVTWKPPEQ